jgi:hypothetical protein
MGHEDTDSAGFPTYDAQTVSVLVHEFNHPFINRLGYAHEADFERSAPRVHAFVADAMNEQDYSSWMTMVNESMVRAAVVRYTHATRGADAARAEAAEQRDRRWLWIDELANLFGEYEADRQRYPTLASFMPRVVAYYDSLPPRLPELERRDAAARPKIVSTSIDNGAQAVDPGLTQLVVRFDRPMQRRVSVVLGPGGRARSPTYSAVAWDSTSSEMRLTIGLDPGREYEVGFNSVYARNFASVDGVTLVPYLLRFKTRPRTPGDR